MAAPPRPNHVLTVSLALPRVVFCEGAASRPPNGLAFSCRERAGRCLSKPNDRARAAVNCNAGFGAQAARSLPNALCRGMGRESQLADRPGMGINSPGIRDSTPGTGREAESTERPGMRESTPGIHRLFKIAERPGMRESTPGIRASTASKCRTFESTERRGTHLNSPGSGCEFVRAERPCIHHDVRSTHSGRNIPSPARPTVEFSRRKRAAYECAKMPTILCAQRSAGTRCSAARVAIRAVDRMGRPPPHRITPARRAFGRNHAHRESRTPQRALIGTTRSI